MILQWLPGVIFGSILPVRKPRLWVLAVNILLGASGMLGFAERVLSASPAAAIADAVATDPALLGWMQGSPPPRDRIVYFADGSYFSFPARRWSVSNFRQLTPTINVSRGIGAATTLPGAPRSDIDNILFQPLGSEQSMSWADSLLANYTDGIVILHRGRIVYERYFGVLTPEVQHGAMSITKTFVGTLAAMMVAEGSLDPDKTVKDYVPELSESAFGDATVRQVMDMTTGVRFNEDYADPAADVWAYGAAGNPLPKPADYIGPRTYYQYLQTVVSEGNHGESFHYRTINTETLGWILARVSGLNLAQLLSKKLWKKLGAEMDAYIMVDSIGTPSAGGGMNLGLRDLARFGEMIRNQGFYNNQQIIPEAAIKDIFRGGDREKFSRAGYNLLKGWSYRNMWWVTHNEHRVIMARGVFGQSLYIDPEAEMVIARFASHPVAGNAANDPITLPAFQAVADQLSKNGENLSSE